MPSVITIDGVDSPDLKGGEKCKWVANPRTGCRSRLCYVGKSKSRTGWKFTETSCPTGKRPRKMK